MCLLSGPKIIPNTSIVVVGSREKGSLKEVFLYRLNEEEVEVCWKRTGVAALQVEKVRFSGSSKKALEGRFGARVAKNENSSPAT